MFTPPPPSRWQRLACRLFGHVWLRVPLALVCRRCSRVCRYDPPPLAGTGPIP